MKLFCNNTANVDSIKSVHLSPWLSIYNLSEKTPSVEIPQEETFSILLLGTPCSCFGFRSYDFCESVMTFFRVEDKDSLLRLMRQFSKGVMLTFTAKRIICNDLSGCLVYQYPFFEYKETESLHLSCRETATIIECFTDISKEVGEQSDSYTCQLVSKKILQLLDYSQRYYERQFITRHNENEKALVELDKMFIKYVLERRLQYKGMPCINDFAFALNYSSTYLQSMLMMERGESFEEYLILKRQMEARRLLHSTNQSIAEIAALLGFSSEECFGYYFRKIEGCLPEEFRNCRC